MQKLLFIFLLLIAVEVKANDGSFYAQGNTLFPLKETVIQLKKEVLNLTRRGEWMEVDVNFEFYNPGPEKEILLGFVTPPASGDMAYEVAEHPQIKEFTVNVEGESLPYKVTKQPIPGGEMYTNGFDHIYHCNVGFKKGITKIKHTYLYRGGNNVMASHTYAYILQTGTTWANGEIEDFELNIDMGDDVYFSLPYTFDTSAVKWEIRGVGKLAEKWHADPYISGREDVYKIQMAYIRAGGIRFKTNHFKPKADLYMAIFTAYGGDGVDVWTERGVENEFSELTRFFWKDYANANVGKLTDWQLRLLRNLPYARAGYDFKDAELKNFFSKFVWYLPDSSVKPTFKNYFYNSEVAAILENEEKKRTLSKPHNK